MACCGGGRRSLRKQSVQRGDSKKKKPVAVKRMAKKGVPKSIDIHRQSLVKDDRCPKCGYTIMLVNIAGRERRQCSNTQCKHVS